MVQKRILVSGGAGFVGSHLCERLVRQGHDVICVDNYYSGRKQNIAHLIASPNFEALRHDVTFPLYVEVDEIYNLACPASPRQYQLDPVQTMKTSVHGAINMLGLAKRCGAKILQASTSEIYGEPTVHPQPESYFGNVSIMGPRSCYDEGKRCAETLFYDYHRQHGVRIKVIRIFNTYGPRMQPDDGRVVSNFVVQALSGAPLTVFGSGAQTRSFCYVDDLIDGMIAVMETGDAVTGPINVGNPEEVTILELAQQIASQVGVPLGVIHHDKPQDDPQRRCPDIALMNTLTGWSPKIPLNLGLERTIAFFGDRTRSNDNVRVLT